MPPVLFDLSPLLAWIAVDDDCFVRGKACLTSLPSEFQQQKIGELFNSDRSRVTHAGGGSWVCFTTNAFRFLLFFFPLGAWTRTKPSKWTAGTRREAGITYSLGHDWWVWHAPVDLCLSDTYIVCGCLTFISCSCVSGVVVRSACLAQFFLYDKIVHAYQSVHDLAEPWESHWDSCHESGRLIQP